MRGGAIPHGDAGTLGSYEELERRLALATDADTVRGLSFHNVLDAVRLDLGPEALARLTGSREAPDFKSFFSYPVRDYLRMQYAAAWMLAERHGSFEGAVRRMSAGMAPGFLGSVVGKAFMLLMKEGPRQLITHMAVAHRAAASFGELTVLWTGPRHGVLRTRRDFLLHFNHEGGLLGLFRALGLENARVSGRQVALLENEVTFSWE
ncbi:TIGR02265 family protein [Melittangium boletus]|uniref:TIGR02265 family protein n=1 Tax=Melittangium boletus TaxID=83453 RepID=UPI003DA2BF9D